MTKLRFRDHRHGPVEIRRPNSEIRKEFEFQNPKTVAACGPVRVSDFLRISELGLRIYLRLHRRLPICPLAIQVDQDISGLSAFAWPDDPAILQLVHDTGGAAIPQPQAPLQKRDTSLLLASNDLDAVLDHLFILIDSAFVTKAARRFGELPVYLQFIAWL